MFAGCELDVNLVAVGRKMSEPFTREMEVEMESELLREASSAQPCSEATSVSVAEFRAFKEEIKDQNNKLMEKMFSFLGPALRGDSSQTKQIASSHCEPQSISDSEKECDADSAVHCPSKGAKRKRDEYDIDTEFENLINQPGQNESMLDSSDFEAGQSEEHDLSQIAQEYETEEEVGPNVAENLAETVKKMMKGRLSDEKVKEKFSQYKRPANCNLVVPRVNTEIWDIMDHFAKTSDLKAQATQKSLLKSACALTMVTDKCLASKDPTAKTMLKGIMDAMGLVLKASADISMERRVKIITSPHVNRKYRKLLSADIPVTDQLFGDDLKGVCATIESTSKLGQNFTVSTRGRKFFPRGRNWDTQPPYHPQRGRGRGKFGQPSHRGQGRPRFMRARGRYPYPRRDMQM